MIDLKQNFVEWKREKYNKDRTTGRDSWESGYNAGLENGLFFAKDIYEVLREFVSIAKEFGEIAYKDKPEDWERIDALLKKFGVKND